jgi:hypothetical protein
MDKSKKAGRAALRELDRKKVPFFARYLVEQELGQVSGGGPDRTTKFPSDGDDEE